MELNFANLNITGKMNKIKYIIGIAAICTTISGCGLKKEAQNKKNDIAKMELKGKIKSRKQVRCIVKDSSLNAPVDTTEYRVNSYYSFNENGDRVEEDVYSNFDESLESKSKKEYDKSGKVTSENVYNSNGHLFRKLLYKYDEEGNNNEIDIANDSGKVISKNLRKFDARGNLIELDSYDEYNHPNGKRTFKYDNKDNITEISMFDAKSDTITCRTTNEYDANGNLLTYKEYNEDGSIDLMVEMVYDKNNHLTSDTMFNSKHLYIQRTVYTNDAKGNPTETVFYSGGVNTPNRREISEYDKAGNWIKRTDIKDGKVDRIEECMIEYYK